MPIYQQVKDTITQHKNKIELTQWAIISGIASLIYSEYIRNFRRKYTPVQRIIIPSTKTISELLNPNYKFMKIISERLIDSIVNYPLFNQYADAPELILFKPDNIEILKTIFDLYMIPNISRIIPSVIRKKFLLDDPSQQTFQESNEIDLFNCSTDLSSDYFNFISSESVLQLLMLIPTMKKDIVRPEDYTNIHMMGDNILTIENDNAICPIHITSGIIKNTMVMELLQFVTNTTIEKMSSDQSDEYIVHTSAFNQVSITKLCGILTNDTLSEDTK